MTARLVVKGVTGKALKHRGTISFRCKKGQCKYCAKLDCPCQCHGRGRA